MEQLHLVNANVLSPFMGALPFSQNKLEIVLESVGLAPTLSETQSGIIPQYAAEKLLCESSKLLDCSTFGFRSFPNPAADLDAHIARLPVRLGMTGLDAAIELTQNIDKLLTGDRVVGRVHDGVFWIFRTTTASKWTVDWAVVQYSLAIFLSGMRQLFGRSLRPCAVSIPLTTKVPALPDILLGIPLMQKTSVTGLGFRIQELSRIVKTGRVRVMQDQIDSYAPLSSTEKSALAACAIEFIRSKSSDMLTQRMAKSFGISVRSYQRRLSDVGTTHSELIERARLEVALRMLAEEELSVTEIALELGYSYPGHFTRFFKQKVGLSPSEYRRIEVGA